MQYDFIHCLSDSYLIKENPQNGDEEYIYEIEKYPEKGKVKVLKFKKLRGKNIPK